MATVKFYSVSKSDLSQVDVVNGQIVCTSDSNGMYYDANNVRYKQQPADDVLYSLFSTDQVTSSGVTSVDYTKDTGKLGTNLNLTATEYRSLEFVFYDNGFGTQFSATLHGLEYGNQGLHTYNWCSKAIASYDTDSTQIMGDPEIYRETVYATVTVSADGTFNVTSKTHITESVTNGIVTMTEKDVSGDNRVALIKVIGRR